MRPALIVFGLLSVLTAIIIPNPTLVNGPIVDKMPLGIVEPEPEQFQRLMPMIWNTNIAVPWNETRDMTTTEATIKCAETGWEYSGHRPFAKNTNGTITVKYDIHCVQWRTEFT